MEFITAEVRSVAGKAVRSLRNKGLLPAVVYGKGKEAQSITVPYRDFLKLWQSAGESSLVRLKLGTEEKNALIHDVALDPLKNNPIHADFYVVDMTKELEVDVPLEFVGEAEQGKTLGGVLVKVLHQLRIKALPKDLPHSISVSVSTLQNPGDTFSIRDIVLPAGVTILNDPSDTVAMIEEIVVVEEAAPVVAEVSSEEAIKNIEVVKPEKKAPEEEVEEKS